MVHLIGLGCWTRDDQVSMRAPAQSLLHLIVVESLRQHRHGDESCPLQHVEQCSWTDDGGPEIVDM